MKAVWQDYLHESLLVLAKIAFGKKPEGGKHNEEL